MKTILVIYTNSKHTDKKALRQFKQYAFNTESDVSVGDMLGCSEYTTNLQVVAVLDSAFTYYNRTTGELSDQRTSTMQFEIVTMKIVQEDESIIYAKKLSLS